MFLYTIILFSILSNIFIQLRRASANAHTHKHIEIETEKDEKNSSIFLHFVFEAVCLPMFVTKSVHFSIFSYANGMTKKTHIQRITRRKQ